LGQGDTAFAEATFAQIAEREPHNAEALLWAGVIAAGRRNAPRADAFLARAMAAGGDTAQASAALALLAVSDRRWDAAAAAVRRAFAPGRRHTFRHVFPYGPLGDALGAFATDGPPALADTLITAALARQPAWSRMHSLRAAAALRLHQCERALDEFVALLEFGIDRPDWPSLVERCRDEALGRR
jgi:hypothetical protein